MQQNEALKDVESGPEEYEAVAWVSVFTLEIDGEYYEERPLPAMSHRKAVELGREYFDANPYAVGWSMRRVVREQEAAA